MSTCSRCGNLIEFRYVNGQCIPLHLYGSCIGEGNSRVNDYSGYHTCVESTCFGTHCPKCGDDVFFIRHNGGTVWIDPPLGPPWYKHACFDDLGSPTARSNLATIYNANEVTPSQSQALIIGVVKTTHVNHLKTFTEITIETGKSKIIELKVKNNAGFLLGKLCIYNKIIGTIKPIDEPAYIFEVQGTPASPQNLAKCPICNTNLNPKNLSKHLKQQHGHS